MRARHRIRVPDGERDDAEANLDRRNPSAEQVASTASAPALARLQSAAGNSAVGALLKRDAAKVQRCACGEATVTTEEPSSTVQRLGLLDDLGVVAGGLFGDFAEQVDQKAPATCAEPPNWQPAKSIPTDIRADTALDFVAQVKGALGGNPHMQPIVSWEPEVDGNGQVIKVNLTIATKIVRPRFAGGRPTEDERKLIAKVEELIKAHEERHRDIARDFAQRAVCAAIGKKSVGTPAPYEAAINKALCAMNKAQEELDHKEGTLKWTLDAGGTKVVDVSLAPEPSASYPC
jgi:hypothetical protein